jgi:glutathione-regulated potassium-efflux system ancillary protein KefC
MDSLPGWLHSSLIYLGAAVIAVPLARAIGMGAILGYLAAGIAIGPWGLKLVQDGQDILHFAEFGVVIMLFLVGLELQPRRLWQLRRSIMGWGSAQVLGCAAAVGAAAWLTGLEWRITLVAGLGLALSSTAIALQVMQERNLMGTQSGQAGFSILLFQDMAAIPILALLPLLALSDNQGAPTTGYIGLELLRVVAAIGAVIVGGRIALRPVLRWIAQSKTPEVFTATALLLVVGIASLMHAVGLSMALGAFLAGVLLADSEYRHALETDLQPFKGLLLGLFFMAVGMTIDFAIMLNQPFILMGIVLLFLFTKSVVLAALAWHIKLPWQERPVWVLLLAQGGEFAFVVFQAAASAQAITGATASLLIAAVAISMLVTPLALAAMDRWLMPHLAGRTPPPEGSMLTQEQHAPVIIAGFGRYGQIVGRLLSAEGIASTVLDHDAGMVDTARQFGYTVYYGDATRLDLLRTAGAAHARLLVVAVDDVAQSLQVVDGARAHFPQLTIVARARDVTHWNALRDRGVTRLHRELFESSLQSGGCALSLLGYTPAEVETSLARFRQHNLTLLDAMYPHHQDRAKLIAVARQGREELEAQMARERALRNARQP